MGAGFRSNDVGASVPLVLGHPLPRQFKEDCVRLPTAELRSTGRVGDSPSHSSWFLLQIEHGIHVSSH
jgi:hypothetical protein